MTGFELAVLGGEVWYLTGLVTHFKRKVKIFWQVCPLSRKYTLTRWTGDIQFAIYFMGMFLECFPVLSFWYVCGLSVTIVLVFMYVFKSHKKYQSCFDYANHSFMTRKKKSSLKWKKKVKSGSPWRQTDRTHFWQLAVGQTLEYSSELAGPVSGG